MSIDLSPENILCSDNSSFPDAWHCGQSLHRSTVPCSLSLCNTVLRTTCSLLCSYLTGVCCCIAGFLIFGVEQFTNCFYAENRDACDCLMFQFNHFFFCFYVLVALCLSKTAALLISLYFVLAVASVFLLPSGWQIHCCWASRGFVSISQMQFCLHWMNYRFIDTYQNKKARENKTWFLKKRTFLHAQW